MIQRIQEPVKNVGSNSKRVGNYIPTVPAQVAADINTKGTQKK